MRKIEGVGATDPNGVAGVIEQMRPGGRHETLRNEFNSVFAQDRGFAAAFDKAKGALAAYVTQRAVVEADYGRRGWNPADLDAKFSDLDKAVVAGAERVPGQESGKSMTAELAEKARVLAHQLFEKVRQVINRVVPQHPAQASAPQMAMSP